MGGRTDAVAEVTRGYRANSYLDDGTDSVFVDDLNGGEGVRMEDPTQYEVDASNNSIVFNSDLGGGRPYHSFRDLYRGRVGGCARTGAQ